jgi:hypothetical protein
VRDLREIYFIYNFSFHDLSVTAFGELSLNSVIQRKSNIVNVNLSYLLVSLDGGIFKEKIGGTDNKFSYKSN